MPGKACGRGRGWEVILEITLIAPFLNWNWPLTTWIGPENSDRIIRSNYWQKFCQELDRSAVQSAGFVDDAYWNFRLISDCTLWLLTSFPHSKPFQNLKATLKTFFSVCFWLVPGNYPEIYKRKTFQRCKQRFWYGPQIFTCSRTSGHGTVFNSLYPFVVHSKLFIATIWSIGLRDSPDSWK